MESVAVDVHLVVFAVSSLTLWGGLTLKPKKGPNGEFNTLFVTKYCTIAIGIVGILMSSFMFLGC